MKKKDGFKGQKAIVLPYDIKQTLSSNDLTKLLYVTDIGFYPLAQGHYRIRENGSKQHILIYCQEGEGYYIINKQRTKVKANQFFIIEAGTPHVYVSDEKNPWSIYWIHFTGEQSHLFKPLFNNLFTVEDATSARFKDRIQLFEEMYQNLEMGYSIENLQYVSLCLWHYIGSLRYIPQFREINKVKSADVIQLSINFMKTNIRKKLTLEDIAQEVLYSTSHFSTLFQKKTGFTPLDYFNHLKIQTACQYLDFSELKIKEIADKLGFYDQYYFSKVFVKYMGCSPTIYRQKKKG